MFHRSHVQHDLIVQKFSVLYALHIGSIWADWPRPSMAFIVESATLNGSSDDTVCCSFVVGRLYVYALTAAQRRISPSLIITAVLGTFFGLVLVAVVIGILWTWHRKNLGSMHVQGAGKWACTPGI